MMPTSPPMQYGVAEYTGFAGSFNVIDCAVIVFGFGSYAAAASDFDTGKVPVVCVIGSAFVVIKRVSPETEFINFAFGHETDPEIAIFWR